MTRASHLLIAARRDASWFSSPGRGRVYHIAEHDLKLSSWGVARCNSAAPLSEFTECFAYSVPDYLRCSRAACKQGFKDADDFEKEGECDA